MARQAVIRVKSYNYGKYILKYNIKKNNTMLGKLKMPCSTGPTGSSLSMMDHPFTSSSIFPANQRSLERPE